MVNNATNINKTNNRLSLSPTEHNTQEDNDKWRWKATSCVETDTHMWRG